VVDDLGHRLSHQGMDIELYLKIRNLDMEGFRKEVTPVAEERIQRALFLVELGRAENVQIQPEELEKQAVSTMNYLYGTLEEKDQRKLMSREVQNNIIGNVLAEMLSTRSLEKFRNIARGIVEEQPAEEAAAETEDATGSEPAIESLPEAQLTDTETSVVDGETAPTTEEAQQETE
jgi:trigger factor